MTENEIAKIVVESAYKVHSKFGPGLLESVYEIILAHELRKAGLDVIRQRPIPLYYEGLRFEIAFVADLWINDKVLVELKSVEGLDKVHGKQVLTYLRLTGLKLGLLINFGEALIKDGIKRVVNGLQQE